MILLESSYLLYIVVFIIFPFSILCSLRLRKGSDKNSVLLDINTCNNLKGIFMVLIIIHHFTIRLHDAGLLYSFKYVGFLGTSVFFFLSGYALHLQLKKKGDAYLEHFISKKIIRLYLPWILCILFFTVLFGIWDIKKLIKSLVLFKVIFNNDYNWFLIAIIFVYLTFYLCYKLVLKADSQCKEKNLRKGLVIECIVICCYVAALFILNKGIYWINSILMFPLGALYQLYQNEISAYFKKYIIPVMFISIIAFCVSFKILDRQENLLSVYYLCSISALIFILCVLDKVTLHSPVFEFLGKCSLELFLVQSGIIIFYYTNFPAYSYSFLVVFLMIVGCAYLIRKMIAITMKERRKFRA